jgi:hypothetical protein
MEEARWSQLEVDPNPVPGTHSAEHETIDHARDAATSTPINMASLMTAGDTIGELDQLALILGRYWRTCGRGRCLEALFWSLRIA